MVKKFDAKSLYEGNMRKAKVILEFDAKYISECMNKDKRKRDILNYLELADSYGSKELFSQALLILKRACSFNVQCVIDEFERGI